MTDPQNPANDVPNHSADVAAPQALLEDASEYGNGWESRAPLTRMDHLKSAQTTLFVIGALTLALNLVFIGQARQSVERELETEAQRREAAGEPVELEKLQAIKESAVKTTLIACGSFAVLGLVFVLLGALTPRYPVACTRTALALYLLAGAIPAIYDPSTIAKGIITKVIMIFFLLKATRSAAASLEEQAAPTV